MASSSPASVDVPESELRLPGVRAGARGVARLQRAGENVAAPAQLGAEREDRLLEHLRQRLSCPGLSYEVRPRRLGGGTEAMVVGFRLAGAPPAFDGPLVLRRFRPRQSLERSRVEAGIHDAAVAAGVRVPRCVLEESNPELIGGAFLLLEWVDAGALLGRAARATIARQRRLRAWSTTLRSLHALWDRIPEHLADAALCVSTVDGASVERAIVARGGAPSFLSLDGRLQRIERRIERTDLAGALGPVLAWLARHRPSPPDRPCLVHGDLVPTNLLVRNDRLVAILDWSKALLAEPEAEIGFLRAGFRVASFAGLGPFNRLLKGPMARIADRVSARFEATRPLDPDRLRWYETMRVLALLSSIEKRSRSIGRRPHVVDPFGARRLLARELERLTGVGIAAR